MTNIEDLSGTIYIYIYFLFIYFYLFIFIFIFIFFKIKNQVMTLSTIFDKFVTYIIHCKHIYMT
jgi:hypothetical protein